MHSKPLWLATAVVASIFMLSACEKQAAAPATPAVPAAATPAPVVAATPPATTPPATPVAGNGGQGGAVKTACADDIKKFCTAAGGEKPWRCLKQHAAELSPACTAARAAAKAKREARMSAKPAAG
ncbi:MAG: hypothetical protein ABI306_00260 [Caulobacteraceae bacterium]